MRKLGLEDVFAFSEIMDEMDLKINVSEIVNKVKDADDVQEAAGIEILMLIFRNLHKAKSQITNWVASLREIDVEEAKQISLSELVETLKELFTGDEAKDFFNSLSMTDQV